MANEESLAPTNRNLRDALPSSRPEQARDMVGGSRNGDARFVIWTPSFLMLFALIGVVGLSMTTVLIQGWLNGHYSDKAVLLAAMPILFCLWLAVFIRAHSTWTRAGALFGCLWSLFAAGGLWLDIHGTVSLATPAIQANLAANAALSGTFICLSLAHTSFARWDTWFFRVLPLCALLVLGASYLHSSKAVNIFEGLENTGATFLLYACCAVWWLRPSCWYSQPGLAFLFGIASLILLFLVIPDAVGREQVFFFQQIFLLCILLGALRVLQGELQYARSPSGH